MLSQDLVVAKQARSEKSVHGCQLQRRSYCSADSDYLADQSSLENRNCLVDVYCLRGWNCFECLGCLERSNCWENLVRVSSPGFAQSTRVSVDQSQDQVENCLGCLDRIGPMKDRCPDFDLDWAEGLRLAWGWDLVELQARAELLAGVPPSWSQVL